jgi:hypothetical protein
MYTKILWEKVNDFGDMDIHEENTEILRKQGLRIWADLN